MCVKNSDEGAAGISNHGSAMVQSAPNFAGDEILLVVRFFLMQTTRVRWRNTKREEELRQGRGEKNGKQWSIIEQNRHTIE